MRRRANRFGRMRRLGPFLVFGMVMLLIAPARYSSGLAEDGHSLAGDGTGGPVVSGDGTGGVNANADTVAYACQRFMLPIYPSNSEEWDRAVASDLPAGSVFILNMAGTRGGDDPYAEKGGPGVAPDPDLQERVAEAQRRGYVVIGYIRTGETGSNSGPRRDRRRTDLEIADLKAWYGVDGIMYDEVWASPEYFDYYKDLIAYGRALAPGLHVINSGAPPYEEYATIADVVGTFEGMAEDLRSWSQQPWQVSFPASKWAASVMSVSTAAEMRNVIWLSRTNNLGYIYVTNRSGTQFTNPWTHLPTFWRELVAQVQKCKTDLDSFLGA